MTGNLPERRKIATLAYIHIPKTAGSSLVALINGYGIRWHHVPAGVYYKEVDAFMGSYRHSLENISDDVKRGNFDLLFGHFTARDLLVAYKSSLTFRNATTLRDPVERMISEYFYSISPAHNGRDVVLEKFPTIEAWVYNNTETEVISSFLEEYKGESAERIATRVMEEYAFVGLTDAIEDSFRAFGNIFNQANLIEIPKVNVNSSKPTQIGDDLRKVLKERNARDVELYALVSSKIRTKLTANSMDV
jgi:hypothetical protein